MASLRVRIVSPEATVFDGEASSVVAPAWDGQLGILPGHAPMIALLGHGPLSVDLPGAGSHEVYVAGGTLKVEEGHVVVLSEYAGEGPPETLPDEAVIHREDVWTEHASPGDPLV